MTNSILSDKNLLKRIQKLSMSVARRRVVNSVFSIEDVSQELMLKLVTVLPKIEFTEESEVFAMAKTIMANHLVDIIRHQARRADTSMYVKSLSYEDSGYEDDWTGLIQDSVHDISEDFISSGCSADELCSFFQMKDAVKNWALTQDEKTQLFIKESTEPSPEISAKWEEMKIKSFRYRHYETIPPFSLSKLLGIKEHDYYHLSLKLKRHLISLGYDLSFKAAY